MPGASRWRVFYFAARLVSQSAVIAMGRKPLPKSVALGEGVMSEQNNWKIDPLAREPPEFPFVVLQRIGGELRIKLTESIREPLPTELHAILEKLESKIDGGAGRLSMMATDVAHIETARHDGVDRFLRV
jgi:hypothetical protein